MCPPPGLARADRGELWKERSPVLIFATGLSNGQCAKPQAGDPAHPWPTPIRYFIATPCGRAGPVANAVLKSTSKRRSSARRCLETLITRT